MASSVGIRALQQHASAVVARVEAGESIEVTDRGRPVARLVPIDTASKLQQLRAAGLVRDASRSIDDIVRPAKRRRGRGVLSDVLHDMRADER